MPGSIRRYGAVAVVNRLTRRAVRAIGKCLVSEVAR